MNRDKYNVLISNGDGEVMTVDVYDVIDAFGVKCPALQHLIKKALNAGTRGHKNELTDLEDIQASASRAISLYYSRVHKEAAKVEHEE